MNPDAFPTGDNSSTSRFSQSAVIHVRSSVLLLFTIFIGYFFASDDGIQSIKNELSGSSVLFVFDVLFISPALETLAMFLVVNLAEKHNNWKVIYLVFIIADTAIHPYSEISDFIIVFACLGTLCLHYRIMMKNFGNLNAFISTFSLHAIYNTSCLILISHTA